MARDGIRILVLPWAARRAGRYLEDLFAIPNARSIRTCRPMAHGQPSG
jgi:hypothetical protein